MQTTCSLTWYARYGRNGTLSRTRRYHVNLILQFCFFDQTGCHFPDNGRIVLCAQGHPNKDIRYKWKRQWVPQFHLFVHDTRFSYTIPGDNHGLDSIAAIRSEVKVVMFSLFIENKKLENDTCNNISVIHVTACKCAGGLKKKLDLRSGSQRQTFRRVL